MTKELIQNLRSVGRLWEDEAADALEAQQKRIELYEQALKASWPEGAIGDAFDYWNAARKEDK